MAEVVDESLWANRFAAAADEGESIEAQVQRADLAARLFGERRQAISLGRFELGAAIGEGGMGVVYEARDPALDRRVAIKVLHSRNAPERLVREAQSMAKINHPNVVEVFDVGTSEQGEFFVAMEFVDGPTLQRWLRGNRTASQITAAFAQAGRGLAAAHDVGVLHRDFKPSNVLVSPDGRMRVTDFGLAGSDVERPCTPHRAASSNSDLTLTGTVLGTPAYMAPEQRAAERLTPAADQFAFCVALFEALYGQRPAVTEGRKAVEDLISAASSVPGSTPPSRVLAAIARGLSWDPAARWPDMHVLLRELRPPNRHRRWAIVAGVAASALVLVSLAGVFTGRTRPSPSKASIAMARIANETDVAVAAADTRIELADSLVAEGQVDAARRALGEAYDMGSAAGADRPAAEAAARLVFVVGYLQNRPEEGHQWARHAAALVERLEDAELIEARYRRGLGILFEQAGSHAQARDEFARVLTIRHQVLGPVHPDVAEIHGNLGSLSYGAADYESARKHYGRALEIFEETLGEQHRAVANALDDLGNADQQFGEHALAMRRYERALAIRQTIGPRQRQLPTSWSNLGSAAKHSGNLVAAELYHREAIRSASTILGDGSPRVGIALANLAELFIDAGRSDEALELYSRALVLAETNHGPNHRETARCRAALGRIYLAQGDLTRAEAEISRAVEAWEHVYIPSHPVHRHAAKLREQLELAKARAPSR